MPARAGHSHRRTGPLTSRRQLTAAASEPRLALATWR